MATMIPPTPRDDSPPGELAVFGALRDHARTADWVVWHGLPIRTHATQVEGEADFVIAVPGEGVLVVEVKSHTRVDVDDSGRWLLGTMAPTNRSPYDQAADNRHSILDRYTQKTGAAPGYPIWSAVWFTSMGGEIVSRLQQRIDVPADSTLTRADLDASRIVTRIVKVLRHGRAAIEQRAHPFRPERPDADDIHDLRAVLTPAIRMAASPSVARERRQADLDAATARQEQILEYFESNPRLLVTGPAGTGKTNIAVRAAQRQANRDERVLLTCFNVMLERDLRRRLDHREDIDVVRAHQLMLAISGLEPPADADDAWWNGTLPAATLAITRADGYEPPFTCIVVDEAQDLAKPAILDVLDSLLVGGLAGARCIVTGDFGRQDIYRSATSIASEEHVRERMPDVTTMTLPKNVRQTPELVDFIERLLDDTELPEPTRIDDEIVSASISTYADVETQEALLWYALEQLRDEGWQPDEIAVLSSRRDSAARRAIAADIELPLPLARDDRPGMLWSTIHAFKGLERPAVVLTDIDETRHHWQDVLYVGLTRATDRLIVLTGNEELAARGAPNEP